MGKGRQGHDAGIDADNGLKEVRSDEAGLGNTGTKHAIVSDSA
jgi:GTP cyclohydrolase III